MNPGSGSFLASPLFAFDGALFFGAREAATGDELLGPLTAPK